MFSRKTKGKFKGGTRVHDPNYGGKGLQKPKPPHQVIWQVVSGLGHHMTGTFEVLKLELPEKQLFKLSGIGDGGESIVLSKSLRREAPEDALVFSCDYVVDPGEDFEDTHDHEYSPRITGELGQDIEDDDPAHTPDQVLREKGSGRYIRGRAPQGGTTVDPKAARLSLQSNRGRKSELKGLPTNRKGKR